MLLYNLATDMLDIVGFKQSFFRQNIDKGSINGSNLKFKSV